MQPWQPGTQVAGCGIAASMYRVDCLTVLQQPIWQEAGDLIGGALDTALISGELLRRLHARTRHLAKAVRVVEHLLHGCDTKRAEVNLGRDHRGQRSTCAEVNLGRRSTWTQTNVGSGQGHVPVSAAGSAFEVFGARRVAHPQSDARR